MSPKVAKGRGPGCFAPPLYQQKRAVGRGCSHERGDMAEAEDSTYRGRPWHPLQSELQGDPQDGGNASSGTRSLAGVGRVSYGTHPPTRRLVYTISVPESVKIAVNDYEARVLPQGNAKTGAGQMTRGRVETEVVFGRPFCFRSLLFPIVPKFKFENHISS